MKNSYPAQTAEFNRLMLLELQAIRKLLEAMAASQATPATGQ
jgi:hypothetical protein